MSPTSERTMQACESCHFLKKFYPRSTDQDALYRCSIDFRSVNWAWKKQWGKMALPGDCTRKMEHIVLNQSITEAVTNEKD